MVKARKLGHLVLNVSDLEASRDFYVKIAGFEVIAASEPGRIVFLTLGREHHDLALIERATGKPPEDNQPGLVHFAWQLEDFAALQAAYKELGAAGIEAEPIQHNVTNSLYMRDPDDNVVELYCDRWGDRGMEVMRTGGPQRKTLDMETGEAVGEVQELLPVDAGR